MPIGNLTSQIFANIYLNEFDRFVKHTLKSKAYLRYGDDFIMFEQSFQRLQNFRLLSIDFLETVLKLNINPRSDIIIRPKQGLKFLGVLMWPSGRKLNKRNRKRVHSKLNQNNVGSYYGVLKYHADQKRKKEFHWTCTEKFLDNEFS